MSDNTPVRLFEPSGEALTLDGGAATISGLMASIHKAVTNTDGLDTPTLIDNLGKVLTKQEMPESSIKKNYPSSYSPIPYRDVDKFVSFKVKIEDWCIAAIGFAFEEGQFAFSSFAFDLSGSMFSSIDDKKSRSIAGLFETINHCYGKPMSSRGADESGKSSIIFYRDDETICKFTDELSGVMSSKSSITVTVFDRGFWDPGAEKMRSMVSTI